VLNVSSRVVVIDYGMGNIWSVTSAIKFLGEDCLVTNDPHIIQKADKLILPGVGSFRRAMHTLEDKKLIDPLLEAVKVRKRNILGICLGFQMMATSGTEDGFSYGLGLIAGSVERFTQDELKGLKSPHIGFNQVVIPDGSGFFAGFMDQVADFYFVHSYRLLPHTLNGQIALCKHGINFVAAYRNENIFGTQFHPEKSQTQGLRLLRNFLAS